VVRRTLPVALVTTGAIAERLGAPGLAFDVLLLAVPAAAVAALSAVAQLVDGAGGRAQVAFWAIVLALVVVAAAARAPSVAEGVVPRTGESALVACLALFCVQALRGLVAEVRRPKTATRSPRAWPGR
jgi:hypothetical protein